MDNSFKILIIEDDAIDARFIKTVLNSAGYDADVAQHPNEALTSLSQSPYDLILADLKMVDMNGIQILELVKRYYPATEVIIITAHASIDTAVEAIRLGAYSYFVKGDPARKLIADVENIAKAASTSPADTPESTGIEFSPLKTRGALFTNILKKAEAISGQRLNGLITGGVGTGRKALARHMCGTHSAQTPALIIDVSTFDESITSSSVAEHCGLLSYLEECGHAGTLLLLNVDDATPEILCALFAELEKNSPKRTSGKPATNVISTSLSSSVRRLKYQFGPQLFYRYWGLSIDMPEIHDRREDLPVIVEDMIQNIYAEQNCPASQIDARIIQKLSSAFFINEFIGLEKLLRRLSAEAGDSPITTACLDRIETADLLLDKANPIAPGSPTSLKEAREQSEREFIKTVYERSGRNKTRTAVALGISARQLYNMLKKYHVEES